MITTLLRILFGFALACLVAGLATVAFVMPPQELLALPEAERGPRLVEGGLLTLAAATQTAIFAAPFALVAVAIGEWQVLRGLFYHIIVGMLIAAGGFLALWAGEEFTAQSYFAMAAYLTAGLMGGFTYWLFSGRIAGDPRLRDDVLLPPPPASNRASTASAGAGTGAAGGSAAGKTAGANTGANTGTSGSPMPVGSSPSPALSPVPASASPAGSASGTSLVAALQKPGAETRQPASPASSTPPGRGQDTSGGSAAGTPCVPRIGPAPQSGPGTGTSGPGVGTSAKSAGPAGPRPFPAPGLAPSTTPGSSSGSPSGSPASSGPGLGPDSGSRR